MNVRHLNGVARHVYNLSSFAPLQSVERRSSKWSCVIVGRYMWYSNLWSFINCGVSHAFFSPCRVSRADKTEITYFPVCIIALCYIDGRILHLIDIDCALHASADNNKKTICFQWQNWMTTIQLPLSTFRIGFGKRKRFVFESIASSTYTHYMANSVIWKTLKSIVIVYKLHQQ